MNHQATFRAAQGQDMFAYYILNQPDYGTFLDIGCNDPFFDNNTAFFEEIGWEGICIDITWHDYGKRRSKFLHTDAITMDYKTLELPEVIDYVSIDIDEFTTLALKQFIQSGHKAKVITIEHDAYIYKDLLRTPQRSILKEAGYSLIYSNVCYVESGVDGIEQSNQWEDWWIAPQENRLWSEIVNSLKPL